MKRLELKRVSSSLEVTMGVLIDTENYLPICLTLELPYKNNEINISCIPKGLYWCSPYSSKKYQNTYIINDVDKRTSILFHTGNTINDTEGCILIGRMFGELNGHSAVLDSRKAFKRFDSVVNGLPFELDIT